LNVPSTTFSRRFVNMKIILEVAAGVALAPVVGALAVLALSLAAVALYGTLGLANKLLGG
jgi:hypothetical protein